VASVKERSIIRWPASAGLLFEFYEPRRLGPAHRYATWISPPTCARAALCRPGSGTPRTRCSRGNAAQQQRRAPERRPALHVLLFVCSRWYRVGGLSGLSPAHGSRHRSRKGAHEHSADISRGTIRVCGQPRAPTARGATCQSVGPRSGHVVVRSLLHLHRGIEAALAETSAGA